MIPAARCGLLQRKCDCGQHTIGGSNCAACVKNRFSLQRASQRAAPDHSGAPAIVHEVLRSPGRPLDAQTRDFFEPRFGRDFSMVHTLSTAAFSSPSRLNVGPSQDHFEEQANAIADRITRMPATPGGHRYDFSNVRIHTDARAAESARAVDALAYTVGPNLVFGESRYAPQTNEGLRLVAHELTHVIQQTGADKSGEKSGLSGNPPNSSIDPGRAYRKSVETSATYGRTLLQRQTEGTESEPAESASESADAEERPATGEEQPATDQEQPAPVAEYPRLAALAATVTELADTVRVVARDNGVPGRTTEVGSTNCNPNTGQPEWRIDRSRIPRCMWPCAERHEQTHAEFMRMPCERVWLPIARAMFWIRIATQYAQQGNAAEVERAMRESEAAVAEGRREVNWYVMYMAQTCRYDEGTAYEAGIEACNTNEIRAQCAANGETETYNTHMATWRRFMQNPPNCPAQPPPPPRRP